MSSDLAGPLNAPSDDLDGGVPNAPSPISWDDLVGDGPGGNLEYIQNKMVLFSLDNDDNLICPNPP